MFRATVYLMDSHSFPYLTFVSLHRVVVMDFHILDVI